jgi:hypothetical protein
MVMVEMYPAPCSRWQVVVGKVVQHFLGAFIENINSAWMRFVEQPRSFAIREKEPVSDLKANIGIRIRKGVIASVYTADSDA